jgi:hypothetical protein
MTKDRGRIATTVTAAAVALTLTLAACGGGVKNSGDTTSATTATTGTAPAGQSTAGQSTAGQSTTGTVAISDSGTTSTPSDAGTTVLGQETVKAPASQGGTVDIAILGLTVHGQLATLTARFSPHFPSAAPDDTVSLYDMSDGSLDQHQVSLVDPIGLKRYLVVQDADNNYLGADENDTEAVNNSSVIAHWTFAAPAADVAKLDVQLGPFPPINDIPVSR